MPTPSNAANGQATIADIAMENIANWFWLSNHADMANDVMYMEKLDGSKAVDDINIPGEKIKKKSKIRPVFPPNFRLTALTNNNFKH